MSLGQRRREATAALRHDSTAALWVPALSAALFAVALLLCHRRRRPRICVIAPGSGQATRALLGAGSLRVHLAAGPEYDINGRRMPPDWVSMREVQLHESDARAAGVDLLVAGRGRASCLNLATLAGRLFDAPSDAIVSCEVPSRVPRPQPAASFSCLVCGSRGGQVTLPALWLLGCRVPAVVINGGCARQQASWAWPSGVPVVLLTGGREYFPRR